MVTIWARTQNDLDAWLPTATQFVDSIHFLEATAAVPPPAIPPDQQLVTVFEKDFAYTVPPAALGSLYERECNEVVCVLYQGEPDDRQGNGSLQRSSDARGIVIANLDSSCSESCDPPIRSRLNCATLDSIETGTTPAGFLAALRALAAVEIHETAQTVLDGRPAVSLRVGPLVDVCDFVSLDLQADFRTMSLPLDVPARLTVVDVGGTRVLIDVWSRTEAGLDAWLPTAQQLLDSIHFQEP